MSGRGSQTGRVFERGALARASAALARRNRHLALAVWLITFVPAVGALAAHGWDRANWRHWADVVFFCSVAVGLTVAWAGEQAKKAGRAA